MEGRAIARPNDPLEPEPPPRLGASMEGRAIARPNHHVEESPCHNPVLQWRAGQLPGRTTR